MCGIAGELLRHEQSDPSTVDKLLERLAHRGPDSQGTFAAGRAAIGQTRLAVIDLDTGDPPIHDESGTVGAALNGEIYNFQELRASLTGHTFATRGDTEVIAHLAEQNDPVALASRLHGMFAFAVWDATRERLILGRDRFGKKPLYYFLDEGALVFASELKALLDHPRVPARLDDSAYAPYLMLGYVPSPGTFFAGVRSLPPGHVLSIGRDWRVEVEPYWQPPARPDPALAGVGTEEAATMVRRELRAAVSRRLIADVPLGAFLSGGVDSTAVVGLMSELRDEPVRTFTIGFEESAFDEREAARAVARRFATDHTEFVVRPDAAELIESLTWFHDQPFGDSSALPTYLLSRMTRDHVTVALSGDGGDELFAGYERFLAALALDKARALPPALRNAAARAASRYLGTSRSSFGKLVRFARQLDRDVPDALLHWVSFIPEPLVRVLAGTAPVAASQHHRRVWDQSAGAPTLHRILQLNLRTYLLDDLLPKVDRMSMAHGLEVRAPFLDHQLAELALGLPPELHVQGRQTKRLLKLAVADLLPRENANRPKQGFGVPLDEWFRGALRPMTRELLQSESSRSRRRLHSEAIDDLIRDHTGGASHGHALWTLCTLEIFLRRWDP